jgi:hypothetical protein
MEFALITPVYVKASSSCRRTIVPMLLLRKAAMRPTIQTVAVKT